MPLRGEVLRSTPFLDFLPLNTGVGDRWSIGAARHGMPCCEIESTFSSFSLFINDVVSLFSRDLTSRRASLSRYVCVPVLPGLLCAVLSLRQIGEMNAVTLAKAIENNQVGACLFLLTLRYPQRADGEPLTIANVRYPKHGV